MKLNLLQHLRRALALSRQREITAAVIGYGGASPGIECRAGDASADSPVCRRLLQIELFKCT